MSVTAFGWRRVEQVASDDAWSPTRTRSVSAHECNTETTFIAHSPVNYNKNLIINKTSEWFKTCCKSAGRLWRHIHAYRTLVVPRTCTSFGDRISLLRDRAGGTLCRLRYDRWTVWATSESLFI